MSPRSRSRRRVPTHQLLLSSPRSLLARSGMRVPAAASPAPFRFSHAPRQPGPAGFPPARAPPHTGHARQPRSAFAPGPPAASRAGPRPGGKRRTAPRLAGSEAPRRPHPPPARAPLPPGGGLPCLQVQPPVRPRPSRAGVPDLRRRRRRRAHHLSGHPPRS